MIVQTICMNFILVNFTLTNIIMMHLLHMQHPRICEFPSKTFYGGKLKTDESVVRRRNRLNLGNFWPQGEEYPMVFCQVVGEEGNGHIGSTRVEAQSKFNCIEAKKIVSTSICNTAHYISL